MFIKRVKKKNKNSDKVYHYLHLVDSVRTPNGPRQRLILNLGAIDVPRDKWKLLANAIEDKIHGQVNFVPVDSSLESYVNDASDKILKKRALKDEQENEEQPPEDDFTLASLDSLKVSNARSIGAEYVCHSMYKELQIDQLFKKAGVPESVLPLYEALIVGRLVEPASEHASWDWMTSRSAIFELAGEVKRKSLSSLYRAGDVIFSHKDQLEAHLTVIEKDLFSLKEIFCLFDLTNTFLEGQAEGNPDAQRGRSKEKRSDCKLVTLGMVVGESGFPKHTQLFPGNQSEPATLTIILESLKKQSADIKNSEITVIMDAGIATEDNIAYLVKEDYKYIVVKRGNTCPSLDQAPFEVIRETKEGGVRVQRVETADGKEVILSCHSDGRELKDRGIREQQEKRFLENLQKLKEGLSLPRRTKIAEKVSERIGRLREKYPRGAKLYGVSLKTTQQDNGKPTLATDLTWLKKEKYNEQCGREGTYLLRTNRKDLSSKEIWETYISLLRIEAAFKAMKSDLGLRPIFHQTTMRTNAHLFISVIAYHILHAIELRLRKKEIFQTWATVRKQLSTHQRITVSVKVKERKEDVAYWKNTRMCSEAEPVHKEIYNALGLDHKPLNRKITKTIKM